MGLSPNMHQLDELTLQLLARRHPRAGLLVVTIEVDYSVDGPSDQLVTEVACARCAQAHGWFGADDVKLYAWDRRVNIKCNTCHTYTVRVPL